MRGKDAERGGVPAGVKTEPLSIRQLAGYYKVGRRKMKAILPHIEGAEQLGGRWRLPVLAMPPAYWLDHDPS